ncbi:MAG: 50S ribosomal protein L15, partial [Clostridia bacterium]|nr:50S ribosomal protein L15 [Clostridia bacterium]
KRGFHNVFAKHYTIVNVDALNVFEDGSVVSADTLIENGIINDVNDGIKILGNGEISKKLTVQASIFSASAKEKIEAAGGKTEVI